ncbi:MAG: CDP-alcohol phosphatidyltransferase family protein, partial [Candidatus Omnitrophica bacterium]|nr:CDP-alcohol phosphatidyltransferase family protein [Candidatus Omnitrophota bacterium]
MTLPNILTISRFFLTFAFVYFILQPGLIAVLLAVLFFTIAALTDYLDGYLAKKYNSITSF